MTELRRDIRTEQPPPTLVERRSRPEVFNVPVELVLACASTATATVIRARQSRGDAAEPMASVIVKDGRFYATIHFGDGRIDLFTALDCWAWENAALPGQGKA